MTTRVLKDAHVMRGEGLTWRWEETPISEIKNDDLFVPIWEKNEKLAVLAYADAVRVEGEGWSVSGLELILSPYKAVKLYRALHDMGLDDHFRNILTKEFMKCHVCFSDIASARWREEKNCLSAG